jgi:hypothetical protein
MGLVDDADATKWIGDPEVDPVAGELTETPAKDAVARARVVKKSRKAFFTCAYSFRANVHLLEEQRVRWHLLCLYQESP